MLLYPITYLSHFNIPQFLPVPSLPLSLSVSSLISNLVFCIHDVAEKPRNQCKFCSWLFALLWQHLCESNMVLCTCRRPRELYTWNKATSCVHNLLGGQRWIDHYGEVIITNHTLDIVCKLTFVKVCFLFQCFVLALIQ